MKESKKKVRSPLPWKAHGHHGPIIIRGKGKNKNKKGEKHEAIFVKKETKIRDHRHALRGTRMIPRSSRLKVEVH